MNLLTRFPLTVPDRMRKRRGGVRVQAESPGITFRNSPPRKWPQRFGPSRTVAGFSLLEIMIASTLLLAVGLSLALTLIYADRSAALSALQLSASHMLQGQIERLRADHYDNVTPANYPDILPGGSTPAYLDAEQRVPATISFDILSTFSVRSATAGSITIDTSSIPRNSIRTTRAFKPGELAGNIVLVLSGKGSTQRGYIKSNTADTITFTGDESGKTQQSWESVPDTTSVVQFNMGKVATVRVSWGLNGRQYSEEMRTLVLLPLEL